MWVGIAGLGRAMEEGWAGRKREEKEAEQG